MIYSIIIDRSMDRVLQVTVRYVDNRPNKVVDSFDKLTEEEMAFFKKNAQNIWCFGIDNNVEGVKGSVARFIVNEYERATI